MKRSEKADIYGSSMEGVGTFFQIILILALLATYIIVIVGVLVVLYQIK